MSPELETLDQLTGGDLPLAVVRGFYPDDGQFICGLSALLAVGEVRLVAADGVELAAWRWREVLAAPEYTSGVRVGLTPAGARRIA